MYSNLAGTSNRNLVSFTVDNAAFTKDVVLIQNNGIGKSLAIFQTQDVEVIDFDGCTDGGTAHTTIAGSVKVQMPNGSTGYINVYT